MGSRRERVLVAPPAPVYPVFTPPRGRLEYLLVQLKRLKRYYAAHKKSMSTHDHNEKAESHYWINLGIQQARGMPLRQGHKKNGPFSEGLVIQRAFEFANGVDELLEKLEVSRLSPTPPAPTRRNRQRGQQ